MQSLSRFGNIKQGAAKTGGALLICQMVFGTLFVGECITFNLLGKNPVMNACENRWAIVAALLIPSGVKTNPSPSLPASPQPKPKTTRRRRTRKTTSTETAK